jgi:hypothetical protein
MIPRQDDMPTRAAAATAPIKNKEAIVSVRYYDTINRRFL